MKPELNLCWLILLVLAGCGTHYSAPVTDVSGGTGYINQGRVHRVNSGETLYAIAWIYDLEYSRLAQLNNITPPYRIFPGQILNVDPREVENTVIATNATSSQTGPVNPGIPVSISRPQRDKPASSPGSSPGTAMPSTRISNNGPLQWTWPASGRVIGRFSGDTENKGIDIDGREGDAVNAAADGEVVYAGRGLLRYGDLIILKHNDRFLSAYAHNQRLLVSEGEQVSAGQRIADLGSTGIDRDMLHFEIRLDGKPVDPLNYLPGR